MYEIYLRFFNIIENYPYRPQKKVLITSLLVSKLFLIYF